MAKDNGRSLSLDLYAQWKNLDETSQFRFTPPTHAILAFRQALQEWFEEGAVEGRAGRYKDNYEVMRKDMSEMGFKFYVPEGPRSYLISTFLVPDHPNFTFKTFYDSLSAQGFVIYPGKLAKGESFRFGTIGRLFPEDCKMLMSGVRIACAEMNVPLPVQ